MAEMNGEASIELSDGRVLKTAFDVNTWIDACDALGMEMPELMDLLGAAEKSEKKEVPIKVARALMWASLQKHQPGMTLRDAGEVLIEATGGMMEALAASLPQDEGGSASAEGDADPTKPPTAAKSGAGAGTGSATSGPGSD